jgi:hypothetical protein
MKDDSRCPEIEAQLIEAFLARREVGDAEAAHSEGCARCGAARAELSRLGNVLSLPVAELESDRAGAILAAARAALDETSRSVRPDAAAALPPGFGRELARLLGFAALPLPLLVLAYAGLANVGGTLLRDLLPPFLAPVVGLALAVSAASWLGLAYGALPFVAHYRTHRRAFRNDEVIA